jgi:murein DD-endopeptidase MepM/ murein hydrolase activator NlpD
MSSRITDSWIYGVPLFAVIHLGLFLALQSRPGPVAIVLWRWGPPTLVTAIAALLAAALWSAVRNRQTWSARRIVGLVGLIALIVTMAVYRTYPSSHDDQPSRVEFRLPLDGSVRVAWGGPAAAKNYHVSSPAERWAYDLLMTVNGVTHRGAGNAPADYYVYGRPVHAPAAGRVVAIHDGDPDARPGEPDPSRGAGNRIVLEVAPTQYMVLAHLKRGTITVAPGEAVRSGEPVALVGNSGNSSEPHVHLHLQDAPTPGEGEGIPFYFTDYVLDGGTRIRRGMPEGGVSRGQYIGDVISSVPPRSTASRARCFRTPT